MNVRNARMDLLKWKINVRILMNVMKVMVDVSKVVSIQMVVLNASVDLGTGKVSQTIPPVKISMNVTKHYTTASTFAQTTPGLLTAAVTLVSR